MDLRYSGEFVYLCDKTHEYGYKNNDLTNLLQQMGVHKESLA